jgi:Zn-dependent protease with chaperone function
VPPVYLLDQESGINAFAAGFRPQDAVLGITRGTLDELSRDQLQGVVGHKFSHILNGDMGLNIRLMGVLNGSGASPTDGCDPNQCRDRQ